ncbi:MAG: N-acetyl-gamma-glutamyl-phosphate reductase [Helicobacteraceae bacterium]|nr:N-acetyl-gamma-glutamyl-phosphate reductase [Helicobacteraceae bacterium]
MNVAVIGASGYTGVELLKMLIAHPIFNINYVATSEGDVKLSDLHPSLLDVFECDVQKASSKEVSEKAELVFLALPHKTAMVFVKELMELNVKVVDLSADYRLKLETYEKHYTAHTDSANLKNAVYGISELNREEIKKASLVANPGCYPTSTILATLPFMDYRVKNSPIIIDAKSGVSGAGKKCIATTHYVSINENMFSYNPFGHRHAPEIAEKLNISEDEVNFIPHLCPVTRGMLSSIYLQVEGEFDPLKVLKEFYKNEPFVRVRETPVDMKSVAGTHFCDLYAQKKNNVLFITSAIDNLLRGASSAAIANANLMMGLEEETALPTIAYVP